MRRRPSPETSCLIALLLLVAPPATADEPIILADFEDPDYGTWDASGEAFGPGPAQGTLPGQLHVGGYLGNGLASSFHGGDRSRGALTSPDFTINRDYIWFLIGGGAGPNGTCIELIAGARVARSATGRGTGSRGSEWLTPHLWDVRDLKGQPARIQIVDDRTDGWGHVSVDHIMLCDEPPTLPDQRQELLARAEAAVSEAAARLGDDPTRPAFHFRPPAQWMNDPNGTIYHDGYYHLFYQHNPYGDRWGNMHWGHARSRDLVRWEHLPIALWPSQKDGEEHIFSGCAAVNGDGELMLFYTSVAPGRPNEQRAALPLDPAGLAWRKHPDNPLITTRMPDGTAFGEGMRDPFIFKADGRTLMVVGADTEDEAVVPIFEAADPSLSLWDYKGILWSVPKDVMQFPECPNFFPLGSKFVLLNSPYRAVEYRVGSLDLDSLKFDVETEGRLDHSPQFYATNTATAPDGRCILFGWVRGFPDGLGWNGCLALPRELIIGRDGHPWQRPVRELEALRGEHRGTARPVRLATDEERPIGLPGDRLEIRLRLQAMGPGGPAEGRRLGLRLRGPAGEKVAEVLLDHGTLAVAGQTAEIGPMKGLELAVFVDRSVLEVFVNGGRHAVTRVIPYRGGDLQASAFGEGWESALMEFNAWTLDGIWPAEGE